jgi:hypothetical protein
MADQESPADQQHHPEPGNLEAEGIVGDQDIERAPSEESTTHPYGYPMSPARMTIDPRNCIGDRVR